MQCAEKCTHVWVSEGENAKCSGIEFSFEDKPNYTVGKIGDKKFAFFFKEIDLKNEADQKGVYDLKDHIVVYYSAKNEFSGRISALKFISLTVFPQLEIDSKDISCMGSIKDGRKEGSVFALADDFTLFHFDPNFIIQTFQQVVNPKSEQQRPTTAVYGLNLLRAAIVGEKMKTVSSLTSLEPVCKFFNIKIE